MTEFFQWVMSWIKEFKLLVTVLPWELAVRVRLGNRVKIWEPGWHLRIPFVDHVSLINTRLRICHTEPQTVTTLDGKALTLSMSVGFEVTNPREMLTKFMDPELTMRGLAASAAAEQLTQCDSRYLIPQRLEAEVQKHLVANLSGVRVQFVAVADWAFLRGFRVIQSYEYGRSGTKTEERQA